jgi:hypothetical protein
MAGHTLLSSAVIQRYSISDGKSHGIFGGVVAKMDFVSFNALRLVTDGISL